jgi:hypothetical protein
MKKLVVILLAVTAIAATSCKKDSEIAPKNADKSIKTFDKTVVGSWD